MKFQIAANLKDMPELKGLSMKARRKIWKECSLKSFSDWRPWIAFIVYIIWVGFVRFVISYISREIVVINQEVASILISILGVGLGIFVWIIYWTNIVRKKITERG